jgi:hypothetical protein
VCGCSNDEHEFKIFKDKMPRKMFGSMNDKNRRGTRTIA